LKGSESIAASERAEEAFRECTIQNTRDHEVYFNWVYIISS
jgi:hypothetical protein